MTDARTEAAYQIAMEEFNKKASRGASVSRYFFYAGAEFGLESARAVYADLASPVSDNKESNEHAS